MYTLKRRAALYVSLVTYLILHLACKESVETVDTSNQRPNIIFILTDDQRYDALGYAGNELMHTPEMDKLAETGTYFKNAMVTTPICAASRASILTGLYERAHKYTFQTGAIRNAYMTTSYPRLLREDGYRTGFFGKYGVKYDSLDLQFDEYESYDRNGKFDDKRGYYYKTLDSDTVHLTRYTGQKAIDFIAKTNPEKPFCLSLSFSAPHAHDPAKDQYFWQAETDSLLKNINMPAPNLGDDNYFNEQPEFVKSGFNRVRWGWRYDTPEKYQHSVKGYYRMISGIDLEIGKIRAELKNRGLDKNTVIVLMGDNGYFLGERQFAGKWLLYDNSVRVPLIIYDPRNTAHQDIEEMVLNVDVPSTILDLAGVEPPKAWQGNSLLPLVHEKIKSLERDIVLIEHLWEFEHIPPSEGIRTKEWKYFRYVNDKSYEELYNLLEDPQEINNLSKDKNHNDVLEELRKKCDILIAENGNAYSREPTSLQVQFKKSDVPLLSWVNPETVLLQTAYQILVASSQKNIELNIGDVWDSGRVENSSTEEINLKDIKLNTDKTYYWKVRIYDEDNRLSAYSDSNIFKFPGK